MKKFIFVYKTIKIDSGEYYYGVHSTDNLNDGYLGSGYKLNKYIKQYGKNAFKREIIKFFNSVNDAMKYESSIVTKDLLTDKLCLNLVTGGWGDANLYCNTTRNERISNALTGKSYSSKGRIGIYKDNEERKINPDELEKYLNNGWHRGRPKQVRDKISKNNARNSGMKGKTHSNEWKTNQSKRLQEQYKKGVRTCGFAGWNSGMKMSEEFKQTCSKAQLKRFENEENRKKISDGVKRFRENNPDKVKEWEEKNKSNPGMRGKKNPNFAKSMKYAMHIRWHVNRNIINNECEYCKLGGNDERS